MADPIEIAWAAGLFEGEGCISLRRPKGGRLGMKFSLASTDEDIVRRFHGIVGCGNVYGPTWHRLSTKPQWCWSAASEAAAAHLTTILGPHLGKRRSARLREVLDAYHTQPPKVHYNLKKTHCPHGHEYVEANIIWDEGRRRCRKCERVRWTRKNAAVRIRQRIHASQQELSIEDVARKVAAL